MDGRRRSGGGTAAASDPPAFSSSHHRRSVPVALKRQQHHVGQKQYIAMVSSPTNHTTRAVLPNADESRSSGTGDSGSHENDTFGTLYNPNKSDQQDDYVATARIADPYDVRQSNVEDIQQGPSEDSTDTNMLILQQQREQQGLYGPLDPAGSSAMAGSGEYSISAKPTRGTFAETFSSSGHDDRGGGDGSDDGVTSPSGEMFRGEMFLSLADGQRLPSSPTFGHKRSSGNDEYDSATGHLRQQDTFSSAGEDTHHRFLGTVNSTEDRHTSVHIRGPVDSDDFYHDHNNGEQRQYLDDDDDDQAFTFGSGEDETQFAAPADMHHRHGGEDEEDEVSTYEQDTLDCSQTLNTNTETLHTNLEGVNYIPMNNMSPSTHQQRLLLEYEEGKTVEDGESYTGYDIDHHRNSLTHIGSYLYEDDGQVHYEDGNGVLHQLTTTSGLASGSGEEDGTFVTGADEEEDGNTFQETLTTDFDPASMHSNDYRIVDRDGNKRVISQMMDSYLSDHSSVCSWEEGSFAGGASRTISRVDSADDDADEEEEEEAQTFYDDSCDETSHHSRRHRTEDRTLMGLFKKFRDMNMPDEDEEDDDDDESSYYDDEEDDDDDHEALPGVTPTQSSNMTSNHSRESEGSFSRTGRKKRRSSGVKGKHRRQKTPEIGEMFNRIGSMSIDFLHDAIDQKQQASKSSKKGRRRSKRDRDDPTTRIMDSFQTIFSCGAPSR